MITVPSLSYLTVTVYKNTLSEQLEQSVLLLMAYHDYWVNHINRYIESTIIKLLFWGVGIFKIWLHCCSVGVVSIATGQLRGRSLNPGRVKNFLFSNSSRPALEPTQPPIQWVLWLFP
jgi:hypothetical protein